MDVLRTCKTHKVFWDAGRTRASTIIWYRVPDTTPFFPGPHVFSSETYDTVHWFNPGAGEDYQSKPQWYDGSPPAPFQATSFCGEPEWYADGAPPDAPPVPRLINGLPAGCPGISPITSGSSGPPSGPPSAPPSNPNPPECGGCTIWPAVWRLELAGNWTNILCRNCSVLNGAVYDLVYVSAGSQLPWGGIAQGNSWIAPVSSVCSPPDTQEWWELSEDGFNVFLILRGINGANRAQWLEKQCGQFVCMGTNVFNWNPINTACACSGSCTATITPG